MKILVTGGAGFIGSHVVDAYVQQGHQVMVLDNLSTGKKKFVNSAATFVEADITNQSEISRIITEFKPNVLNLHAAHIQVGYSVENPQFDAQNNILGLLNIMEAAKQLGTVKKVLLASTGGAMYGDQPTPFTESMDAQPLSPYGISKRSGELYLHFYFSQYQIPYIALRYANVYGPRQNPHGESGVVAIFSEMLMQDKTPSINGDGTNTRDYVYVSDVVKANLAATESDFVGELNIGTGVETSTNQVFTAVASALQKNVAPQHGPARPGEQITSCLDYSKANQILDWKPEIDFESGVNLVADWYKSTI